MNFSHLQYQLCNYSLSELVQAVQQQHITPQLIDGTQRLLVLQTAAAPLLHNYQPPVRVYQLYQAHFTKRELQQLNRWYNRK